MRETSLPGVLKTVSLSNRQGDLLFEYMSRVTKKPDLAFLHCLTGIEGALEFLDIFAGNTLRIPKRSEIYKAIIDIKMYDFCERKGFTKEAIEACSRVYRKKPDVVERVVERVKTALEEEIYEEDNEQ